MARKNRSTNLKIVQTDKENLGQRWEKAEEEWKITSQEARHRVHVVRDELESYRDQIEALPFDILVDDTPYCLDIKRKDAVEIIEEFTPFVRGIFEKIDDFVKELLPREHQSLDFNAKLFMLERQAIESGFQVGVLAGVIFAGCPKEQIDKFERGLAFAIASNRWIVKR
jgi:hypothetical protein